MEDTFLIFGQQKKSSSGVSSQAAFLHRLRTGPILFLSRYCIRFDHNRLNGITKINAGIKSTSGTDLIRETRNPAAMVKMPPHAERSANMVGVSTPARSFPAPKTSTRMASTTAVIPDALMTELTPIAMEHRPNIVGRCSFSVSGSTLPRKVPSSPPSRTAPQFVNTPIGILFPPQHKKSSPQVFS